MYENETEELPRLAKDGMLSFKLNRPLLSMPPHADLKHCGFTLIQDLGKLSIQSKGVKNIAFHTIPCAFDETL